MLTFQLHIRSFSSVYYYLERSCHFTCSRSSLFIFCFPRAFLFFSCYMTFSSCVSVIIFFCWFLCAPYFLFGTGFQNNKLILFCIHFAFLHIRSVPIFFLTFFIVCFVLHRSLLHLICEVLPGVSLCCIFVFFLLLCKCILGRLLLLQTSEVATNYLRSTCLG